MSNNIITLLNTIIGAANELREIDIEDIAAAAEAAAAPKMWAEYSNGTVSFFMEGSPMPIIVFPSWPNRQDPLEPRRNENDYPL